MPSIRQQIHQSLILVLKMETSQHNPYESESQCSMNVNPYESESQCSMNVNELA